MYDFKILIKGLREVYKNGTRDDKYRCITTSPKEYTVAQKKKIFPEASTTQRWLKNLKKQLCQIYFYISFSDILCIAYINNYV